MTKINIYLKKFRFSYLNFNYIFKSNAFSFNFLASIPQRLIVLLKSSHNSYIEQEVLQSFTNILID